MHARTNAEPTAANIADAAVRLIDKAGYSCSVALLTVMSDYPEVSWDFLQNTVRPIVERLRPGRHRSRPTTSCAASHAALEKQGR